MWDQQRAPDARVLIDIKTFIDFQLSGNFLTQTYRQTELVFVAVFGGNVRCALHTRSLLLRFMCAPNKREQPHRNRRKSQVTLNLSASNHLYRWQTASEWQVDAVQRSVFFHRENASHVRKQLHSLIRVTLHIKRQKRSNLINLFPVVTANSCRRPPRRRYARSRGVPANPITWSPVPGISEGSMQKPEQRFFF